nr:putative ribonuclease H-like domain-containing protein [Tanacetum cinerariifolium]
MRVASINGKKYILLKGYRVYNKRTRLIFESIHLRFDKIKEMLETSVANDISGLVPQRQKAGIEFLNKTLNAFFKEEGIEHQTSTARTPEQNGVVKRRDRTLVEAARTMLSTSQLLLFFWDEAITTACYAQN